jgi:hypothetical protein
VRSSTNAQAEGRLAGEIHRRRCIETAGLGNLGAVR